MRYAALLSVLMGGLAIGAAQASEARIELRRIDDPALRDFATRFFLKRHPHVLNWSFAQRYRSDENWAALVRDQVYQAEIGIGADGARALLLTVGNPNWCQANGCLSAIFRNTARGYELICETALPAPPQPGAEILDEIENGYHRLATPSDLIVWNASQDYDSGQLCSVERRPD